MDRFGVNKKNALSKLDKSRKGSVDEDIIPLLDRINKLDDYFTTSSCSGRIMLIAKGKRKDLCDWLYVTHKPDAKLNLVKEALLPALKSKKDIWFKQEQVILHVSCRDVDCAARILVLARDMGLRRSGIISTSSDKVIVQIIGSLSLEAPVAKAGKLAVDDSYLTLLVGESNRMLKQAKQKIKEFEKRIASSLK